MIFTPSSRLIHHILSSVGDGHEYRKIITGHYEDTVGGSRNIAFSDRAERRMQSINLNTLNETIRRIQKALHHSGLDTVYVSGGSALAVLDSIFNHKPISMVDLDLNVYAPDLKNETACRSLMKGVLDKAELSYVPHSFKEMRRILTGIGRGDRLYIAGHRFFAEDENLDCVVDISMFSLLEEVLQNGYLDTQLVKLPLQYPDTLLQVRRRLREMGLAKSLEQGLLIDRHNGFASFQQRRHVIVYRRQVIEDPCRVGIRLVGEYAKFGQEIPEEVVELIRENIHKSSESENDVRNIRNVMKLLKRPNAWKYIHYLEDMGTTTRFTGHYCYLLKKCSRELRRTDGTASKSRAIVADLTDRWQSYIEAEVIGY